MTLCSRGWYDSWQSIPGEAGSLPHQLVHVDHRSTCCWLNGPSGRNTSDDAAPVVETDNGLLKRQPELISANYIRINISYWI